jgi:hypothetical protein
MKACKTQNSFTGLKMMKLSKNMGMKFYVCYHITAISTPVNLSGPRRRGIIITTAVKMGLEWKLCGRNHCSRFVFFVHWLQGKDFLPVPYKTLLLRLLIFLYSVEAMV